MPSSLVVIAAGADLVLFLAAGVHDILRAEAHMGQADARSSRAKPPRMAPMARIDRLQHGRRAWPRRHALDPHESPLVMMIPLVCPRLRRAVRRRLVFRNTTSSAKAWRISGRARSISAPTNHILEEMEHIPQLVSCFADADDARRLPHRALFLHSGAGHGADAWAEDAMPAALPLPAQQMVLRRAL